MSSSLFSIVGKTAVVTGGGRGIGRMIASTFVDGGAKVYITSRDAAACNDAAAELSEGGPGSCHALPHDLSREAGVLDFVAELSERESKLNVLVNNSGASWGAPLEDYPEAAWQKVFSLNVASVFHMTRACLPLLRAAATAEDPSRVINIGSITGITPQPVPTYAYDTSKAAVHHLTVKLSSELSKDSITVNAIAPGFVPSKMSDQLMVYGKRENFYKAVPLGRWGTTEDMGGTAVYLASRAGAWTTGQVLGVDGGSLAQPLHLLED